MADEPPPGPGHEHDEACRGLYAEWQRYHSVVADTTGRFAAQDVLAARRELDAFEHQLRLLGCSVEAREEAD